MRLQTLSFVLLLLLVSVTATATASPIIGSLQIDFVDTYDCYLVNDLRDIFPTSFCSGWPIEEFRGDLALQLTISDLEIDSTTVFAFKSLEFQMITLMSTIGAFSVKDTFIFSPSIAEIEFVRTHDTLTLQYCINKSAPYSVPIFEPCPFPDSHLYRLMRVSGSITELI